MPTAAAAAIPRRKRVDEGDKPERKGDLLQHHRDRDRQAAQQAAFMDQQVQRRGPGRSTAAPPSG